MEYISVNKDMHILESFLKKSTELEMIYLSWLLINIFHM